LPWLEATFRLSERLNATTGRGTATDRAFDVKLRLIEEGAWTPAVAVGLQDLIGTGIFGGEYVVASRRWRDFDLTLGMGFGRLGTYRDFGNPLTAVSERFAARPRDVGRGGTLRLDFFRGRDVALFGGLEWSLPPVPTPWGEVEGLRAKLEFSGDRLRDERGGYPVRRGPLRGEAASRINAGLQWSGEHVDAGIAFVNGTDLLLRVALRLDPANPPPPRRCGRCRRCRRAGPGPRQPTRRRERSDAGSRDRAGAGDGGVPRGRGGRVPRRRLRGERERGAGRSGRRGIPRPAAGRLARAAGGERRAAAGR
jgi:hypothetical protein